MKADRARLYLHIGRNKAGSTTLQAYCLGNLDSLKRAGIQYVLFGYPSPPGSGVPSFPSHYELGEFVREQRDGAVLVSHEGLCCFPDVLTQVLATDLSDLDVQVIFYVRPYRDWVVSSYKFDVRAGFNGRDFDRYLDHMAARISVWPMLRIWGETIGWANIRVRSTHSGDLVGGHLLSDFLAALAVENRLSPTVERLNTAPSWVAVELMRTVLGRDEASGWDPASLAVAEVLNDCADVAVRECGGVAEDTPYLTRPQARHLADFYNSDLAAITERTGVDLMRDEPLDLPERTFLPSVHEVPRSILRFIRDRVLEPHTAGLHPQATDYVNQPAFRAYCGMEG